MMTNPCPRCNQRHGPSSTVVVGPRFTEHVTGYRADPAIVPNAPARPTRDEACHDLCDHYVNENEART